MNIDEQFWSVDDWHEAADSEQTVNNAVAIMLEEVAELNEAKANEDLIEMADAYGDIMVTLYGVLRAVQLDAAKYNLPLDVIFEEIMDSNWSKYGGTTAAPEVIKRGDGKILKGPDYFTPNLKKVLEDYYGEAIND